MTQHLVLASIENAAFGLPLSGLIQQTANSIFFFFITKKTGFDISCNRKRDLTFHAIENGIWHFMQCSETICIKCQILFSWKNEKNIPKCLLKILPRVLSVKVCTNRSGMSLCMAKPITKLVRRDGSACTLWTCTSLAWSEPLLIVFTSNSLWV